MASNPCCCSTPTCPSCTSCSGNAPCCLSFVVSTDWVNAADNTWPCFDCDEMTTDRTCWLYRNQSFESVCVWSGTICTLDFPDAVCDRSGCFAAIIQRGTDYILQLVIGTNSPLWLAGYIPLNSIVYYEKNFGTTKPDCVGWSSLALDKVSDDANCTYSNQIYLTAGLDYCPRAVAVGCYQCGGTTPNAFSLELVGVANGTCDSCESSLNGTEFILTCDSVACTYVVSNSCLWDYTSPDPICGSGCALAEGDMCLNYFSLRAEYVNGIATKLVVKVGRRKANEADVIYATWEKQYATTIPCLTLDVSSGWTLTSSLASSRNKCNWSNVQPHVIAMPTIVGCTPKYKPCNLCEDPENNGLAWQVTMPSGMMAAASTGCCECTTGNCQIIEGQTYQLDFTGAEQLDFYTYCRYRYAFSCVNCSRSYGDDGEDFCGQFGSDGGHRYIWRWIELYIVKLSTGVQFQLTVKGSGFSIYFTGSANYLYNPINNDPRYIDCTAPITLSLTNIGGTFGTGCSWSGVETAGAITGGEATITLELA